MLSSSRFSEQRLVIDNTMTTTTTAEDAAAAGRFVVDLKAAVKAREAELARREEASSARCVRSSSCSRRAAGWPLAQRESGRIQRSKLFNVDLLYVAHQSSNSDLCSEPELVVKG